MREAIFAYLIDEPRKRQAERLLLLRGVTGSEAYEAAKVDARGADVWPVGKVDIEELLLLIAPGSTDNPFQLHGALKYIEASYQLTASEKRAVASMSKKISVQAMGEIVW